MSFKDFLREQPDMMVSESGYGIDIFFNNLDEVTQKKIMEAIMKELNVSEDDEYSNKKIVEGLSKTALVTLTGKDITNKIKFDI